MSLNIGNEAIEAAANLRHNEDFTCLRDKLAELANQSVNIALEADGATRDDKCGYARALRDLWIAFESAATGERYNQVRKPGAIPTRRPNA